MTKRFIDYTGKLVKVRRPIVGHGLSAEDVSDPDRLSKALTDVTKRLGELEAIRPPEAVEFEVTLPSTGVVRLNHGFGTPVRWYPVWSEDTSLTASTTTKVVETSTPAGTYKFDFDFTSLSLGGQAAATFLTNTAVGNTAGLVFARSTISTVQTSASTVDLTPAADAACIGNRTSTLAKRGLVIQSRVKNFVGASVSNDSARDFKTTGAQRWTAGSGVTGTFPFADSPDGSGSGCSRMVVTDPGSNPGNYGNYAPIAGTAQLGVVSLWCKRNGSAAQMVLGTTAPQEAAAKVIYDSSTTGWQRLVTRKGTYAATAWVPFDCRNWSQGSVSRFAGDALFDLAMYEIGDFPNEATVSSQFDRFGDRLSYATGSQLVAANGQLKMYCRMTPKHASTMQVNYTSNTTAAYSAGWYLFSWGAVAAAADNFCYVRDSDKKLVCKLAGGTQVISNNSIGWNQYDTVEIYLAVGSNLPTVAKYKTNDSSVWNDLIMGPVVETPAPGSTAVFFFVNSVITHASGNNDIGAFPCWLHRLSFYDTGFPSGVDAASTFSTTTVSNTNHQPDVTVNRAQTTPFTLALNSYNAVKTVIRIESAPEVVSPPLQGI